MRGLRLPRSRSAQRPSSPYRYLISLLTALAMLAVPTVASASGNSILTVEQLATARWSVPFQCPDGSTGTGGRLIAQTSNFFELGTTPGPYPPLQVSFTGQCQGRTFSWGGGTAATQAPTEFAADLTSVRVSATYHNARDSWGGVHTLSVDVHWVGTGPLTSEVYAPDAWLEERAAVATATITLDGTTLVDGAANYPYPAPFIRVEVCA